MLTKREVDQLSFDLEGPSTQILYDEGGVPGFGVRVRKSGGKSFVLWYRTETGRARMITLGKYGVMTIKQAREDAKARLVDVARGGDPLEERRSRREADTVASFAEVYMKDHARRRKRSWKEDRRRLDRYIIPALGRLKLAEVRRAEVARMHRKIGGTKPYEANRVLALVSVMFSKAIEWGYLPDGTPNPARRVQRMDEKSRNEWVRPEQMPMLAAAIEAEESPYIRAAFKLYLLTGLRRAELLGLKWSDVDLSGRRLRLADTKAKRAHEVHLSEPAAAVLEGLPRLLGNPYVFASERKAHAHLVNVTAPWKRIRARFWLSLNPDENKRLRKEAEEVVRRRKRAPTARRARAQAVEAALLTLADEALSERGEALRIHDLRRTTGSWLAADGVSLQLIGKVLNHSNTKTTETYAKLAEDATQRPLDEVGKRMAELGLEAG